MTFDGVNKLVILDSTTLDLIGLWSAYKTWLLAGNARYVLGFDTAGGEPIDPVAGTRIPLYLFVQAGWRIRPMEADHTLRVTNGSLIGESGGDPFVDTMGAYTVRVRYEQPVQAFGYSSTGSSGPSAADIATATLAAAQVTPIHADMRKTNNVMITGTGVPPTYANEPTVLDPGDPFRPA